MPPRRGWGNLGAGGSTKIPLLRSYGSDASTAGTVAYFVRSARDILLGLNKGNEQKLGDWSFEVDQSAQAKPKAAAKPKP
jgi:hypothetical protein